MISFETVNELTLKVTCSGNDVLFTKAGAFIAGDSAGGKNYRFEKVLLGPQGSIGQAALGSLIRRVTGENLPLMKVNILSQKGLATSVLTGNGSNAYVAILTNGNPIVLSNVQSRNTISVDPDAVICWMGQGNCDPQVKADISWKNFIGQASGESYAFEWSGNQPVSVVVQPSERRGGISVQMD